MDFILKLTVPATESPVSLAEAKSQIEDSEGVFDDKLKVWIPAAVREFERMTRRALMPQTWLLETQDLVCEVELPRPPLLEIVTVKTKMRIEDAWVDAVPADYTAQTNRSPVRLTWIETQPRFVQVVYRAGYDIAASVPDDYKLSILQLIAHHTENRGDVEAKLPIALKAMIASQSAGTRVQYFAQS